MATRILLPDAGQTTDELLLMRWYVSVGDSVEVGDILADIETDKAVAELEAYVGGTVLALLADEGDTVTTGQTLLWIGDAGEAIPEEEAKPDVAQPSVAQAPQPAASKAEPGRVTATPAARTAARERGVSLAEIPGTGPEACIVKRDVLGAAQRADGDPRGTSVPLSPMRRALAARLQASVREAPQFSVAMDVDMTAALAIRQTMEPKPTVTDVVIKAAADTLAQFPQVNARLEGEIVHYLAEVNVGIAVSVENGLVVPVLARADTMSLAEVASASRQLIESARAGRLAAGARSSFTVSNLGMFGVKSFTAIINPPEAAILAVGAIGDRVALQEGQAVAVPTLTLTLTCDHRLIDGALAARFLQALRGRLQSISPAT